MFNRILGLLLLFSSPFYLAITIPMVLIILFFILIRYGYLEAYYQCHLAFDVLIDKHFHGIFLMIMRGYPLWWWQK